MAIVTLEDMKAELNILSDVDDALITAKIDQAQAHLEALLGYEIETEFADPLVVPADLVGAVKMLAAGYYETANPRSSQCRGRKCLLASRRWFATAANTLSTASEAGKWKSEFPILERPGSKAKTAEWLLISPRTLARFRFANVAYGDATLMARFGLSIRVAL